LSAHSHLTCSFTLPAVEPIWMQRRWADAPAALQGSSVLATATATAPFGNEWVGQVPDLQLGFLLPIATRAILRRANAQGLHLSGSSSRPDGPYLRELAGTAGTAGTAGVAGVDAMHPSEVHEDPYSMIEGFWHSIPNRTGSPTACTAWTANRPRLSSDLSPGR
jgi:hypothetical protein